MGGGSEDAARGQVVRDVVPVSAEQRLLGLLHAPAVQPVLLQGSQQLFSARRHLYGLGAGQGARPVLEGDCRVPKVRVLERVHLVACKNEIRFQNKLLTFPATFNPLVFIGFQQKPHIQHVFTNLVNREKNYIFIPLQIFRKK